MAISQDNLQWCKVTWPCNICVWYLQYCTVNNDECHLAFRPISEAAHSWSHNKGHTRTQPFNSPFSRTTRVGRYQKGKTNLDFTEARDSEWQWHQLGICKSAPRSRQITTPAPHHSVFYRPDALPVTQPTASKHWRQIAGSWIMDNDGRKST